MKRWINISDAVEITNNRVKPFKGERRYLATGDLVGDAVNESIVSVDYENKPSRADLLVDEGDIIVARMQATNKVLLVDKSTEDLIVSTGFLTLQPQKYFDGSYLAHYFQSDVFQKQKDKYCSGATQKAINNGAFGKLQVPSYPLDEQKSIANILDHADSLRQKRKQSLQHLDDFLRATFFDMFGDPAFNQKKWELKKFGDCIEYIGDIGSNGSNANVAKNLIMSNKEDYAIMIRTVNLNSGDYTRNIKYISKKTYDYFAKSKIYGGEIIMNKIGSAGQFWIMPNLNRPVSLGLNQLVIRLKDLNTHYLYYYLSTKYCQMKIGLQVRGAATKSITKLAVKTLPLLYPPIDLQNQFASIVEQVEQTKQKMRASLDEMDNQFNALTQRYFD